MVPSEVLSSQATTPTNTYSVPYVSNWASQLITDGTDIVSVLIIVPLLETEPTETEIGFDSQLQVAS
jgi:hypothetical protein